MSRPLSLLKSSSECAFKSRRQCLNSLESKRRLAEGSVNGVLAARRYAATAAASLPGGSRQQRVEYLDEEELDNSNARRARYASEGSREATRLPYPKPRTEADAEPLVEHLQRLFPPLEFPATVAMQMLTHISAKEAWAGHNARLAFVGRRVLHSYLLLFLHSASLQLSRTTSPPIDPDSTFNFDLIAYRALHTNILGEFVGAQWDLARTILWVPAVPSAVKMKADTPLSRHYANDEKRVQETPGSLRSPGLYKVQGTTVEGIMGGIFHQFGGTVAQRVFHTRLLPHILCPGTPFGLHDAFHQAVLEMQSRMGGADGFLVTREASQARSRGVESHSLPANASPRRWSASRASTETAQATRQRFFS